MELKQAQKDRRAVTRVTTTGKRVCGRHEDLLQAHTNSTTVADIKVVFQAAQQERTAARVATNKAATRKRRLLKKEETSKRNLK